MTEDYTPTIQEIEMIRDALHSKITAISGDDSYSPLGKAHLILQHSALHDRFRQSALAYYKAHPEEYED